MRIVLFRVAPVLFKAMKKTIAILILLAAVAVSTKAQDINSSIRYWDEGKLTWDDFEKRNFEGEGRSCLSPLYHT